MTMSYSHLSFNGINSLFQQQPIQQPIAVQIVEFQLKKNKVYFYISDGNFKLKATTNEQGLVNPETDLNTVILIKNYMVWNNIVGIIEFEKIFDYDQTIGTPQMYTKDTINPQNVQTYYFDKTLIKNTIKPSINNNNNKQIHLMSTSQKSPSTTVKQTEKIQHNHNQPPQSLDGNIRDYETIKQLYIGMDRWTIVCRIVKKEYKQFNSKKNGKQTKVLSIELMDRAGMKIAGVFFGDAATSFKDYLTENRIYKISRGQIRQQSYNNSKNDKISPYKLIFTNLSLFEEVSDTNSIAKNEDAAITLGECVERKILGQEFDVICILVKIQDTIDVKREDGITKKTNLLVADPVKNITLHATLWNENLIPKGDLVGRSIILSRFKLTEYKSSLSLAAYYRSSIIPVNEHIYQNYEKKVMDEFQDYEKLHQIVRNASNQSNRDQVCMTFMQLERKIEELNYDQWTRGDYYVYINKFNLKKWHYDGCPYCNKSAQKFNNCPNSSCQKYVEKTIGHFILGIEVCDSTGSLWTTAYDELAKKIFHVEDQNEMIERLLKLDANQLKEQTERYLYQEFKLRISTKKDKDGKIKHNISKIYDRDYIDETQKTIELINKILIQ